MADVITTFGVVGRCYSQVADGIATTQSKIKKRKENLILKTTLQLMIPSNNNNNK